MSGKRLTADQRELLRGLIRDGLPFGEIADVFGVTHATVSYYAVRMGLPSRGPDAEKPEPAKRSAFHHESSLPSLVPPGAWAEEGLCAQADPDAWFPEKGGSTREGKAICAKCPVAAECLDYALANNERFGIWGGLSERERRRLTKSNPAA